MSFASRLAAILRDVDRPGDFQVAGRIDLPTPRINVNGVGPLALPVLPAQAEALIKVATRAPYGRGAETIVDTSVRSTWQIEASQVSLGGKHWAETLAAIVRLCAEGLGVSDQVTAELYKLLIYEEGSFFVGHRDTEKSPGMFATLVVVLPSSSEGGALIVRHKDREARIDLANDEPSEATFAAFYADCVHEVLRVTSGCRVTLVFNLVRKARGAALEPPDYEPQTERLETLLGDWGKALASTRDDDDDDDDDDEDDGDEDDDEDNDVEYKDDHDSPPLKLVWLLEHAYTPAELRFESLKGTDAAIARLLLTATPRAGIDLHLALLQIRESGSAQYVGSRSWHSRRADRDADNADEYEIDEVNDSSRTLSEWRRPDGTQATLGDLPFKENEISPPDALEDMEPDEEHFQEATGNEGASFERTYARAALVLWPSVNGLAVLNQAGTRTTLPFLDDLITRWIGEGASPDSLLRHQAEELARHMLTTWSAHVWFDRNRPEPSDIGRMLVLLARLGAGPLIETMLATICERKAHGKADNPPILQALGAFPIEQAATHLAMLVVANAIQTPGSCAALLAAALDGPFNGDPALLLQAATALVDALPGDPAMAPKDQWGRRSWTTPDPGLVADLITVMDRVDAPLAQRFAGHVQAWPQHFDHDSVLVPAMKSLCTSNRLRGPALTALHQAAIEHLETRMALTLEPPRDWARANPITCRCDRCRDLSAFLGDPARQVWTLRAVQDIREHVEVEVTRSKADLDLRTDTKGRPYTLICTKNRASYARRVAQRERDVADVGTLRQSSLA